MQERWRAACGHAGSRGGAPRIDQAPCRGSPSTGGRVYGDAAGRDHVDGPEDRVERVRARRRRLMTHAGVLRFGPDGGSHVLGRGRSPRARSRRADGALTTAAGYPNGAGDADGSAVVVEAMAHRVVGPDPGDGSAGSRGWRIPDTMPIDLLAAVWVTSLHRALGSHRRRGAIVVETIWRALDAPTNLAWVEFRPSRGRNAALDPVAGDVGVAGHRPLPRCRGWLAHRPERS
jgi:hypothetical protein